MKKILFWAAVTFFAAVSCDKFEGEALVKESNVPTFKASVEDANSSEDAESRTKIDGLVSYWDGAERIWVLNGAESGSWKKAYAATAEKQANITFKEEADYELSGTNYLAIYPAGVADYATWSGDFAAVAKGLKLTSDQTGVLGSYDPSTHIAIATAEEGDYNLHFKNVTSLVKFTLTSDNVTEVCFYGNNSEVISGKFDVAYNEGNPVVSGTKSYQGENNTWAKIKAKSGALAKGTYYISVLPATFSKGFAVESIDKTYQFKSRKKDNTNYTLGRKQIMDLGDIAWKGKLYLNAGGSGLWDQGSAWFSAYFMDANKSNTKFVSMTKNAKGVYVCDIPSDKTWKYVIFVRNDPKDKTADWTNVWNQTADLELQKGKNCYKITGWSYGDWSEYAQ